MHGPTGSSKEGGGGAGRRRAGRRDGRRAGSGGGGRTPACRVKNPVQGTWFATQTGQALTRAIAAADPGDRLNVFGRCRGSFSIAKDLQIFGNTNRQAPTVLDAAGGGILSVNTLTLNQTTVSGNVPDDCAC